MQELHQPKHDDLVLLFAAEFQSLAELFYLGFQLLDLLLLRTEAGLKLPLENPRQLLLDFVATRVIPRRLPLLDQFMDTIPASGACPGRPGLGPPMDAGARE